jgi:hypothetical protein
VAQYSTNKRSILSAKRARKREGLIEEQDELRRLPTIREGQSEVYIRRLSADVRTLCDEWAAGTISHDDLFTQKIPLSDRYDTIDYTESCHLALHHERERVEFYIEQSNAQYLNLACTVWAANALKRNGISGTADERAAAVRHVALQLRQFG